MSCHSCARADFGSAKAKCLTNAEVALILEHKRKAMQSKGIQPKRCAWLTWSRGTPMAPLDRCPPPICLALPAARVFCSDFAKAYQYVNTVKQFRDDAVVRQVRGYAHVQQPAASLAAATVMSLARA